MTKTRPIPTVPDPTPLPLPATPEPARFPPSAELGLQLRNLGREQAEIDRKKAEELARLRAIQDRD